VHIPFRDQLVGEDRQELREFRGSALHKIIYLHSCA
jgi:hypothetical protein